MPALYWLVLVLVMATGEGTRPFGGILCLLLTESWGKANGSDWALKVVCVAYCWLLVLGVF